MAALVFKFISIYFWLHWLFVALHRFSLVVTSGLVLGLLMCTGLVANVKLMSPAVAGRFFTTAPPGSSYAGFFFLLLLLYQAFSSWGKQGLCFTALSRLLVAEHRLWVHGLQSCCTGLVTPYYVQSSQIRDWTHVPCIVRWILIHCSTKEVVEC